MANRIETIKTLAKRRTLFIASLLLELLLMACGQAGKVPFVEGTWVVIDHKAPRISAMGREQADSWIGKAAQYTKRKAFFDGNLCASPVYKARTMRTEDLYSGFKIAPESLGYEEGPIEIIEVYCGNSQWVNPGGTLIRVGKGKLYLVWDGVFFRLQEQRRGRDSS